MSPASPKVRADVLLVERGLAASRSEAQALILAGGVLVGSEPVAKPGTALPASAELSLKQRRRFVSRGGDKLAHGLDAFARGGLTVAGKRCLDIGASTGGFTDCLLQRGAARVVAVDVGYGQLHPKLRADPRVDVRERLNARELPPELLTGDIDLVVVDVSFISLDKLIGVIAAALEPGGDLVALIKPQFEAGRAAAAKARGVIRDERVRQHAIGSATAAITAAGFTVRGAVDSPIRGPKGNLERLLWAERR